jgi:hypothetical protein
MSWRHVVPAKRKPLRIGPIATVADAPVGARASLHIPEPPMVVADEACRDRGAPSAVEPVSQCLGRTLHASWHDDRFAPKGCCATSLGGSWGSPGPGFQPPTCTGSWHRTITALAAL